jgi:phosphoglycolate phosphatase
MNRVLAKHNFPIHNYDSYKYFVGKGIRELVTNSLPGNERKNALIDRCLAMMIDDYDQNCLTKTQLYDGIPEILKLLKYHNIPMSVFSNKREALTIKIIDHLVGSGFFVTIVGARTNLPKKPDPAGALLISKQMGINPKEIAYIGDTNVDMITANSAGMFAIGVSWGFREKDELLSAGAKVVIDEPEKLLRILEV